MMAPYRSASETKGKNNLTVAYVLLVELQRAREMEKTRNVRNRGSICSKDPLSLSAKIFFLLWPNSAFASQVLASIFFFRCQSTFLYFSSQ